MARSRSRASSRASSTTAGSQSHTDNGVTTETTNTSAPTPMDDLINAINNDHVTTNNQQTADPDKQTANEIVVAVTTTDKTNKASLILFRCKISL